MATKYTNECDDASARCRVRRGVRVAFTVASGTLHGPSAFQ
ncbi:hypothetical protein [Cupriavidus sp. AU9028]|nr:hypothetical protein [Cupriavidus sp. AU9028]